MHMPALALRADPTPSKATLSTITRAHLEHLRRFASSISGHAEQQTCGRSIRRGKPGSADEVLTVVKSCKRKLLCPTCGYAASRRAEDKLVERMARWTDSGGSLALLTLTVRHKAIDRLDALWDEIEAGWGSLTQGSQWCRLKRRFGIAGYVRVTEVVHSSGSGWSPHFHVVILLTNELSDIQLRRLRDEAADHFGRGVTRLGGGLERTGQDLRPIVSNDIQRVAAYCSKGLRISRGRTTSRTPMAILDDLMTSGAGADLWNEFRDAARPRRRYVVVSHRLDQIDPPHLLDI